MRADVEAGLTAHPKTLPPKWFYDERGSEHAEPRRVPAAQAPQVAHDRRPHEPAEIAEEADPVDPPCEQDPVQHHKPREGEQPEGRPETVGEQDEGPRAEAGGDPGGDVGALGAEGARDLGEQPFERVGIARERFAARGVDNAAAIEHDGAIGLLGIVGDPGHRRPDDDRRAHRQGRGGHERGHGRDPAAYRRIH